MKRRIQNWLLRYLFNPVLPSDIIMADKNGLRIGGKLISQEELKQLKAEVKALEGFRIWNILTNSLRFQAHDKVFNKSLSFDDVIAGKLMLLNVDTQESIIRVIKNRKL